MTCEMPSKECEDKDSIHYFMCHMTQQEFNERFSNDLQIISDFNFNRINYNKIKAERIKNDNTTDSALRHSS